jgi:hypothetical protein
LRCRLIRRRRVDRCHVDAFVPGELNICHADAFAAGEFDIDDADPFAAGELDVQEAGASGQTLPGGLNPPFVNPDIIPRTAGFIALDYISAVLE